MKISFRGVLAALALGATAVSAQAADLASIKGPAPAPAIDTYQPFQVRLKVASVVPTQGTSSIYDSGSYYPGVGSVARASGLALGPGTIAPGASTTTSWSVMPMVDIAYYLNKNWAIEAICCVTPHHVQGTGVLYGASLANTWVFPPSVMLQYHFTNFGAFQPYLGVGANFTAFWGTGAGNNNWYLGFNPTSALAGLNGGVASFYSTSITPSWGAVGQIGADYMFNEHWGVNFDVKYIQMQPNAHANIITTLPSAPSLGAVYIPVTAAVKINPIVVSTGLTYRFGNGLVPPVNF